MKSLDVIVGGQFGSEAKGHVTKRVIEQRLESVGRVINIRVAGPNAGHCVLDDNKVKYAMRQLPVGFVFPNVDLVIAPGSEIDLPVLLAEIELAEKNGHHIGSRLLVDYEATMLYDQHKETEMGVGLQSRIGSTGKGIGACRSDRIMRTAKRLMDDNDAQDQLVAKGVIIANTPPMAGWFPEDEPIVIEGTQGYGLGLHASYYPQCTSSDTRAIDFCAMAGTNPWDFDAFTAWVVARVYPIRVAGNSGPLKGESSWADLRLPVELTTVTQKERRVGGWDEWLITAAIQANGPRNVKVALTMLDQKFPDLRDVVDYNAIQDRADVQEFLDSVSLDVTPAPIALVTTGEDHGIWMPK